MRHRKLNFTLTQSVMLAEICGAQIKFYIPPCSACGGRGRLIRFACKGAGGYSCAVVELNFTSCCVAAMKFCAVLLTATKFAR